MTTVPHLIDVGFAIQSTSHPLILWGMRDLGDGLAAVGGVCPRCGGAGQVRSFSLGPFDDEHCASCPECGGDGDRAGVLKVMKAAARKQRIEKRETMGATTEEIEDVTCERETDKAILLIIAGETAPRWIPKSVIHDDSEVFEAGGQGTLVVARWFAEKEGLGG